MLTATDQLIVVLPDLSSVPEDYRAKPYVVKRLLTDGEDNPKLVKSDKSDKGYLTFGLTLSPAKTSGYNLCSSSSPGCRASCLHYQGYGRVFDNVPAGRIAKTIAFMEEREWFLGRLRKEVGFASKKAAKAGLTTAIRLNVLSDVMWESVAPNLFDEFPSVTFYDYTKHFKRMLRFCYDGLPPNYHLTFSRSERNEDEVIAVLSAGGNVSTVFHGEQPASWFGWSVFNGDKTDLRFLDPPGHIIGLTAKGSAKHDSSGFVVRSEHPSAFLRRTTLSVI